MSVSIPGGATMAADGKTWQNAAGLALTADQIAAIEKIHAERTAQRETEEAARMAAEARGNPIANALMAALRPQAPAPQPPVAPRGPSALELEQHAIEGVAGRDVADRLFKADLDSFRMLADASDDQLLAIEGVTPAVLKRLRALKR